MAQRYEVIVITSDNKNEKETSGTIAVNINLLNLYKI